MKSFLDTRGRPGYRKILIAALLIFKFGSVQAVTGTPVEFPASTPYQGNTITLEAELFRPDSSGPHPAVVLMHGCGGLSAAVQTALRGHAQYLVEHGYVALVLDSFGPRGEGGGYVCKTIDRLTSARIYRSADALDAHAYLQSLDFVAVDSIFQMGQSNGASVSIRLAQLDEPVFRASAAFYPWCGSFNRLGSRAVLTSPLIVFAGALDDWTPPADCLTIKSSDAEYRVTLFPGAVHSFDLDIPLQEYNGHKIGFDPVATRESRIHMLNFFAVQLSPEMRAGLPPVEKLEVAVREYLSGDQISRLMPGGKLRGINGYGNPYTITYTADGDMSGVAGKSGEYRDTGKWWIEGSSFCRQYKSWLEGRAACFRVTLEGENIGFYDTHGNQVSSGSFKP